MTKTVAKTQEELNRIVVETDIRRHDLTNKRDAKRLRDAGDFNNGYFLFHEAVSACSVSSLLSSLRKFSRLNPGEPITIEIKSPGGSIIDGFHLYDELLSLKASGNHELTLVARGNIASMAVPIFQAADHRKVGASCFVMIHRAAFGAMGKAYEIEDQVEFVQRIEGRIVDILVHRGKKDREYYADLFKQRKDVWFSAEEAVELGLADEVG